MKKIFFIVLMLMCITIQVTYAADAKVSELPELAVTPDGADTLYIIDGTTSKKITVTNLLSSIVAGAFDHDDLANITGTAGQYNHPTDANMTAIGNNTTHSGGDGSDHADVATNTLKTSLEDNSVTLAKMAPGTAGNIITFDASGNPAAVATGTVGQVLTSGGAGVAPTMQNAGAGDLISTNNLSDVANAATAYANIKQSATDTATGAIERATDAETVTGSDNTRATTPANLVAKMAAPGAIGGTTPSTGAFTTVTTTGGVSTAGTSVGPQLAFFYEDSDNGTQYVGWGSQASNTNANELILLLPITDPTTDQILEFAAPAVVTFTDGVSRRASIGTWTSAGGAETNSLETTITGIADTEFPVGDGADSCAFVVMSGDATMANTGAVTIVNDAITTAKINTDAVTMDSVDADGDFKTLTGDWSTTGAMMAGINTSSKAGAYTIGTDDVRENFGTMFTNSNVADLTLPGTTAVIGANGCLMQGAGVTGIMQLEPGTGSHLVYQGVEMTDGTPLASGGAATDKICWVAISADHYLITGAVGTWAE